MWFSHLFLIFSSFRLGILRCRVVASARYEAVPESMASTHKLILLPNLKSNAFTHGSLLSLLDLLLPPALPPHPLLLHHPAPPLPPLPLVHLGISALAFKSNCTRVKGQKQSQKPVRNQSETVRNRPNAISLSLSLPIPHPPIRTPTPTPIAISTTTTASATATASPAGTTVSFPDRFRTAQAYFASKFEIECVHAWILTPTTRFATTLSTTHHTRCYCTTTTTSTPRNFCSCF